MKITLLQINLIIDQEIQKLETRLSDGGSISSEQFNWLDGQVFILNLLKNRLNNLKKGQLMDSVEFYICEDPKTNQQVGDLYYGITGYEECKSIAQEHNWRVIALQYTFYDSELVDDFSLPDEEKQANEESHKRV